MLSNNPFDDGSLAHEAVQNIGQYLIKNHNVGRLKCINSPVQFVQPQSNTSNIFIQGNSQLSFLLPIGTSNAIDICRDMIFEFTVTNGSGVNALTLLPVPFWLSLVQLQCGGAILENFYPENLMADQLHWQKDDFHINANQTLENYTYSASTGYTTNATTIAASASKTFYWNFYNMINRCQLFLPAINQQMSIILTFSSTPYTSTSVSTSVSLNSARLIMEGLTYEPLVKNKLLQRYQQNATLYSYNTPQREIVPGVVLNNASPVFVQITSFSGMKITCILTGVRTNAAQQENLYTFTQVSQYDLKNAGQSIFLNQLNYPEYQKMNLRQLPNSVAFSENLFIAPFSVDTYHSINDGIQRGYLLFSPNFQAQIVNSANATYEIVFIAYQQVQVQIKNGNLTMMPL